MLKYYFKGENIKLVYRRKSGTKITANLPMTKVIDTLTMLPKLEATFNLANFYNYLLPDTVSQEQKHIDLMELNQAFFRLTTDVLAIIGEPRGKTESQDS